MQKLTLEQAIVISGYTGFMATPTFSDFHGDVEKRIGHPVWTHEFASEGMRDKLQELYRKDFLAMVPDK